MAAHNAKGEYLEVQTPVTIDGINLAYDENKKPIYRTAIIPAAGRKELERNTAKLPEHLRPKFSALRTTAQEPTDRRAKPAADEQK